MPVRYLAGSFNYHTEDGALVGDHAMSLIATARAQGVEPVAYLTECLRSHEDLAKRPQHYLPWVYRERNSEAQSPVRDVLYSGWVEHQLRESKAAARQERPLRSQAL